MSKKKRAVVTGGAGFLGSHLCEELLKRDLHVTCVDNLSSGRFENVSHIEKLPEFEFVEHDVIDPLPDLKADYVFNLACPASPGLYQADPLRTAKTAAFGTLNALELARANGAQYLQASTSEIYGDPEIHPQVEGYWGNVSSTGPRACYDEGKRFGEALCFDFRRVYDLEIKVVRIFNTYGPRMQAEDGRVVSNFIVQALQGMPITIYGDGSQTRSFCFVSDLVSAMLAVSDTPSGVLGPFNIGNPEEVTVLELAKIIQQEIGLPENLVFKDKAVDDPRRRRPDISKVRAATGWQPEVPLSQGIAETIAYFRGELARLEVPAITAVAE
ncbi:NAD-dependent epimerase/dehydratase family protein [Rhodobacterales bacterium HKCCE2091]|nr:NAD-dependent epimerase/dehydratase family protein [Rhodobacterales bacterium HKCCE2091]